MKTGQTLLLCGITLVALAGSAAAAGMKPGLWEITTTTEMPGMPFTPPPMTVTHCYTPEDVKDQQSVVPKQEGDCRITDLRSTGSRVTWKMVCSGKQQGKGSGEITFSGSTAYQGKMKFTTEGMTMNSSYKAKRLGECQ